MQTIGAAREAASVAQRAALEDDVEADPRLGGESGGDDLVGAAAEQLLGLEAEHRARAGARVDDPPLEVEEHDHHLGRGVEQAPMDALPSIDPDPSLSRL